MKLDWISILAAIGVADSIEVLLDDVAYYREQKQ